jgi:acetyl-CoA C-acetyltransferase
MPRDIFIVEAVRTPVGRRNGGLSTVHPVDLLGVVQREVVTRSAIDPAAVGQVIGGCVSQVGEQAFSPTRNAWLAAGLPLSVAATTVDAQCGSAQQASSLASALVGSGMVEVAIGCGVESMSRIPIGSSYKKEYGLGRPVTDSYFERYEFTSQFEGAERIADQWGLTRHDTDAFGLSSQQRAARAWAEDRFGTQIVPVTAPVRGEDGKPTGETQVVTRDEGLRETTLEKLGTLKPVARENGVHTAGSSSQISDGAAAVMFASQEGLDAHGLRARARVVDTCLVGSDPVLMLTGPIPATRLLFERTGLTMDDIDVVEINEAFASVVLAWAADTKADMERVNPNGGAIALGHPLGATGAVLLTKALHELERTGGRYALVTMCCGGGLGTGTIIERLS